ncbi:protein-L-isoaspartate O-methyltransferase [Rhodoplanes sp. TEM]|uniref:Protein-L-isoaspartate O-methyltransferase n=1 Tax=Rhodoplanes tepidamans TaxID=200616 RepID=A0ABT5JBG5_RHOTP|nr:MULTISPECIES: protein-L-isoaspartate O-methyltransferase [Rhodoplanes]MDC7786956.1 protein-L-isoaspartate O-methyltransferase [Rhodoplanes tepidamans]MDC7985053.1 protein-L-isoaspartate O-methyltransferase [Rhodoplanes sp. TEM]MDQ0355347.1 protein-L-isoaspartate(D-aspartate) O-methyltransferase [Rhodoplanes tepidamans]
MDFAAARRKMVDNQVRPNGVTDRRLIDALLDVPREHYVPAAKAALAYMDGDLPVAPVAHGKPDRCLIKPMVLARMIQALELAETDRVLDLACGTGYSTAVLARLVTEVVGLEETPALAESAGRLLASAGVANARVVAGPLEAGWPEAAPYDAILVNGTVDSVPPALLAQLAEGGRLIAVVATKVPGEAILYRSVNREPSGIPVFDASIPALPAFAKPPAFVF